MPNNRDIFIDSVTKGQNSIDCDYFPQRKASFACYGEEPLELVAFMRCNGCQNRQGQLCPAIAEITEALQQRGMAVVRGTH